jgi:hypothetical protein
MSELDFQRVMSELNWLLGFLEGANQPSAADRLKSAMLLLGRVKTTKD